MRSPGALSKDPEDRFEAAPTCATEVLAGAPADLGFAAVPGSFTVGPKVELSEVRRSLPCPACGGPVPVGGEFVGARVRCLHCKAFAQVALSPSHSMILRQIADTATTTEVDVPVPVLHPPTLPAVAPGDPRPLTASWSPPVLAAKAGGRASRRRRRFAAGLAVTALVLIGAVLGLGVWGRRPGGEERVVINAARTPPPLSPRSLRSAS